ncbi:MAG: HD domain-containing protein [Chloroflexi bacterium]|jgi:uncharacterized protein|nr:HD domain-containing protein [Chloroflexota bacterium]
MPDDKFADSLEEFVSEHLAGIENPVRARKVIHECTWGTNRYERHEIALLDTPLLQRLRDIQQLGFGFFTFPTAIHSRFDHTLGVVTQASHFSDMLREKYIREDQNPIQDQDKIHLRLAALLHDVGHCIFSHASEEVYGLLPEMQVIRSNKPYVNNSPHEVLTAKILETKAFGVSFDKVRDNYTVDCKIEDLTNFILGHDEKAFRFRSDILNGPFDADKLDYQFRDARFSGIPMTIDLDRLWYATGIGEVEDYEGHKWKRLVVDYTGTSPLEQILFNRIQLYPSLYHHHKVRAGLCMLKGIIEYVQKKKQTGVYFGRKSGVRFNKLSDFLWGSELDFWAMGTRYEKNSTMHNLVHDLQYRRLLKRAMIISFKTIKRDDGWKEIQSKRHSYNIDMHEKLRKTARRIAREARKKGIKCYDEQVWIDLPLPPRVSKDMWGAFVQFSDESKEPLPEVFPIQQWLELYDMHKWRGHVFVPLGHEQEFAPIVKGILKEEFKLNPEDTAFTHCNLTPPK